MGGFIDITSDTSQAEQQINNFMNGTTNKINSFTNNAQNRVRSIREDMSLVMHTINIGFRLAGQLGENLKQTAGYQTAQIVLSQIEAQWAVAAIGIRASSAALAGDPRAFAYASLMVGMEALAIQATANRVLSLQNQQRISQINSFQEMYR